MCIKFDSYLIGCTGIIIVKAEKLSYLHFHKETYFVWISKLAVVMKFKKTNFSLEAASLAQSYIDLPSWKHFQKHFLNCSFTAYTGSLLAACGMNSGLPSKNTHENFSNDLLLLRWVTVTPEKVPLHEGKLAPNFVLLTFWTTTNCALNEQWPLITRKQQL